MSAPVTVTSQAKPCECGWLDRVAANPKLPISFDPEMNEFHLEYPDGIYMIYYCPFCGGKAPESLRPTFFAVITPEEETRLKALTGSLKTLEDVRAALGPPDFERHMLTYRSLSATAAVQVFFDYATGQVGFYFQEKNVQPKSSDAAATSPPEDRAHQP